MKYLITFSILYIWGCKDNEVTFPKSYSYSHTEYTEGLYLLSAPNAGSVLDLNSGSFEGNWPYIKEQSETLMRAAIDLQEIELISEDSLRIQVMGLDFILDTIVSYTMEDKEIVIEALADSDLIYFDSDNDQFVLCGFTLAAVPGPYTLNPGAHYNHIIVEDCQKGADLTGHLNYVLGQNDYRALDTIGLLITKFIYK